MLPQDNDREADARRKSFLPEGTLPVSRGSEALAALRRREALLRETERLFGVGSWEWAVGANSVSWSEGLLRLVGYEPDEWPDGLVPETLYSEHLPEAERRPYQQRVDDALAERSTYEFDHWLVTRQGIRRRVRVRGAVQAEDGGFQRLVGTVTDVTAEHEATERLRESEAVRNDTERFFGYGSWVWDLTDDARAIVWSAGNARLYGYEPDELPDGHVTIDFFYRHVHPDDLERLRRVTDDALRRRDPSLMTEFRAVTRQGQVRHFMRRARLVLNERGQPLRFVGHDADVTDERHLADQLSRSEELNRRINEVSPDFIAIYDVRTGRDRYVGRQLRELLGYSEPEIERHGGTLLFALEPDEWDKIREFQARIPSLSDGEFLAYQLSLRGKNGQRICLRTRATVFSRDEAGLPAELMSVTQDVTELEEKAEALRQSEMFNRRIIELSPDFVNVHDLRTGQTRYLGRSLRERLGYTDEEVAQRGGTVFFAAETEHDREMARQNMVGVWNLPDGEFVSHRLNLLDRAGQRVSTYLRATVLRRDETGAPTEAMVVIQDVTERERLLDQLRRTEALLSQTEESLLFGSWEWNVATRRVTWSAGLWRIFGYDNRTGSEPVTRDLFFGHLHPDDRVAMEATIRRAIAHPEPFEFAYRITDAHGNARSLEGRAVPLFDEKGHLVRLVGNTRDVTGERASAERFEKQEYLLREAENLLSFGSWEWDLATGDILWSEGLYAVFGYGTDNRPARITFGVYRQHLHPDEVDRALQRNAEVMREKGGFEGEYRILTADGQERWVHEKGIVVTGADGQAVRLMGSTADVTELRRYRAELEQRVADLNRSNADLEQFAYVASHDLQEPLRKITSFGERLHRRHAAELGTDGRLFLERMIEATARMKALIDNLLAFSRVTRRPDTFVLTDLNAVLAGVRSDLEVKITEKGAHIEVGSLPTLEAVPGQMEQVFQNLLSNALKFSRPDQPLRIRLHASPASGTETGQYALQARKKYLKIEVEDNGIGFEPDYAERIFVLFQRLHGRSDYEGTGIGLAIVKKIVENHQGVVFAESSPGQGARFTLLLPLEQENTV